MSATDRTHALPRSRPAPLSTTVEEACRRWADRPAITFGDDTITYAELWQRVRALAGAYESWGIGHGDRILCQLRNCPEMLIATGAAWQRGAVHVGADNDLTGAELARLAQRFDPAAVIYQPARDAAEPLEALGALARAAPQARLIVHGAGDHDTLADLLASAGTDRSSLPEPLDDAIVFLTSGTTGEPKAVMEPLAAHWAKMQFFADAFQPGADDVMLLPLPISHVFGSRLALLTLLRGAHLVLMDRFSPDRTWELVDRHGVTVLPAVPTHLRLLRERYDPARHDVRSLRWIISAAAGLPQPLAQWVYDTLDVQIVFVFGCSEGFTILTTDADDVLAGSVGSRVFVGPDGTPADGRVRVVDPEGGAPLATGQVGEIAFGSRVPVRYWDTPDAATDGWYRTGDLGYLDAHGRVHLTGRLKELINRGGLHVSCAEVELAVMGHGQVADAGVVGVPDEILGEAVCACVMPKAGQDAPTLAKLRESLSGTLARHKLPDELCVVDEIPRTEIGKVDRPALASRVAEGAASRERVTR